MEGTLAADGRKGRSRSRIGSRPGMTCGRMLSWTKRVAVAGALAQRSRGMKGARSVGRGVCVGLHTPGLSVSTEACRDRGSLDSLGRGVFADG